MDGTIAEKRKPFWTKKRYFAPLLAAALVNAVVYAGVTYRLATKQERLTRELAALSERKTAQQAELATLRAEGERIARNQQTVERFFGEVVGARPSGLTEALAEIDRLAREASVERGRTNYTQATTDVGLAEITASMPLRGSYFDLVSFVNRLERSSRFFLLKELELASAPSGSPGGELELRCAVSFFLRDEPPGPPRSSP
jgi:Tfp pilus assembly protein PilO